MNVVRPKWTNFYKFSLRTHGVVRPHFFKNLLHIRRNPASNLLFQISLLNRVGFFNTVSNYFKASIFIMDDTTALKCKIWVCPPIYFHTWNSFFTIRQGQNSRSSFLKHPISGSLQIVSPSPPPTLLLEPPFSSSRLTTQRLPLQ